MRNALFGVVSSAAIGAALLATTTSARADADVMYPQPANPYGQGPAPGYGAPPPANPYQGPAPGYGAPPPANPSYYQAPPPAAPAPAPVAATGGDLFVYGGSSNYHPPYGKAYGPDAAPPGAYTQAGVCWLFPPDAPGGQWQEVCR